MKNQSMDLQKDDFRVKYFKAVDLIMTPTHTTFGQPSLTAFFLTESNQGIPDKKFNYIREK